MIAILSKEFKSYFNSPIGYVFMAFFLLMFGLYFTALNVFSQNSDYTMVLSSLNFVVLLSSPILTMRLLSEERKNKTDQLLITAPIRVSDIVLGKYLSAIFLFGLTLLVTLLHSIMLMFVGTVPILKILGGYLGFFLLGLTLIAIGLFISALSENQIISAIVTLGVFIFLILIDGITTLLPKQRVFSLVFMIILMCIAALLIYLFMKSLFTAVSVAVLGILGTVSVNFMKGTLFDGLPTKLLQWLSVFQRFDQFSKGILDLSAVIYYLSFSFIFIFLTIQVIEKRSWS